MGPVPGWRPLCSRQESSLSGMINVEERETAPSPFFFYVFLVMLRNTLELESRFTALDVCLFVFLRSVGLYMN